MEQEFDDNGVRNPPKWKEAMGRIWHSRALKKRTEFATLSAAFCHKQKHALIVLADPETDVLFVAYDDQFAVNRITDVAGKSMKVVKKALKGEQQSIQNLVTYVAAAINKNHESILERHKKGPRIIFEKDKRATKFRHYEQLAKTNEMLKIEKSEAKKKREIEMNKLREDQEKIDIETGLKKVGPIEKIKDLFRKKILK